jgi:hypothetical protein
MNKGKAISVFVVAMLALGFLTAFLPVHAYTPLVANVGEGSWSGAGTTYTFALTVTAVGDTIAVFAGIRNSVNNTFTTTSITSPGVAGGMSLIYSAQTGCQASAGCSPGHSQIPSIETFWTGTTTSSGSLTFTVTIGSSGATYAGAEAYDLQYVGSPAVTATVCFASTVTCGGQAAGTPVSTTGPSVYLIGGAFIAAVNSASSPCGFVGPDGTVSASAYLINNSGSTCGINFTGGASAGNGFALITTQWGNNIVTSTTTINTMCMGACTGGNNGTGNYLIRNLLYFYQSQNVNQVATIDNITLKLGTVHMNVTQGILYVAVYFVSGIPSAGNPYAQITGPTGLKAVPLFNVTSSNTFIHVNPQALICASCYYAVGVMASPEGHSRGGGAANSGVQVLETSVSGITEYTYAPAGPSASAQAPPTIFFSSTVNTSHNLFIYVHTVFPVYAVTSTTTSTFTVGGTATTTISVTSTNYVNQLNMSSAGFWFLPLLFLMAPVGFLIAIKRFASGGD